MAKRNWNVMVVVPGRENNDGTTTEATYFQAERVDAENGSRRITNVKEIAAPVLVNRKTGKRA